MNKDLLADREELGDALNVLEAKLNEAAQVVPEKACEKLRRFPIWMGVDDGTASGQEDHPNRESLDDFVVLQLLALA